MLPFLDGSESPFTPDNHHIGLTGSGDCLLFSITCFGPFLIVTGHIPSPHFGHQVTETCVR